MVSGHRHAICVVTSYIEQDKWLTHNLTLSLFLGEICWLCLTYFELEINVYSLTQQNGEKLFCGRD